MQGLSFRQAARLQVGILLSTRIHLYGFMIQDQMKCRDRPTWPSGFYSAELEDSQGPGRKSAVCRSVVAKDSRLYKNIQHAEFVPNNKGSNGNEKVCELISRNISRKIGSARSSCSCFSKVDGRAKTANPLITSQLFPRGQAS